MLLGIVSELKKIAIGLKSYIRVQKLKMIDYLNMIIDFMCRIDFAHKPPTSCAKPLLRICF